jgi:RNA polymerase sigma factor (sigma-70 family)
MGVVERSEMRAAEHSDGLEQVYLDNRQALLRFLRARGAGEAAEDLLQELWIKAAAGAVGPIRDPLPYLYRTANNLMLDRRRAEIRQARREGEYVGPADGAEPVSDIPHEERALIAREELRTAQEALNALGERTEAVFRRFRLEGATQKKIAEEEGISLSAVEKHLQKAYRALIQLRSRFDAG